MHPEQLVRRWVRVAGDSLEPIGQTPDALLEILDPSDD
jgi:hypothetical protein